MGKQSAVTLKAVQFLETFNSEAGSIARLVAASAQYGSNTPPMFTEAILEKLRYIVSIASEAQESIASAVPMPHLIDAKAMAEPIVTDHHGARFSYDGLNRGRIVLKAEDDSRVFVQPTAYHPLGFIGTIDEGGQQLFLCHSQRD